MPGVEPKVTQELALTHGLTAEEYDRIIRRIGREPTFTELGLFSALWSEHCAYKHSRIFLRGLPSQAPHVLQGPGENAGIVDLGGDLALTFKIESHNHPSFIEPFQGAATGVGGILRDIFTMGARPIAILDSLRFGAPEDPKTRRLIDGVVSGISWYGNCFGVPNLGGEVNFGPEYAGNPLVNAMAVGLVRKDRILRARAEGPGNPVLYVGAKTGRDGIHGATMASATFDEGAEERRPTVQVGDPFTEKLLLEACLEAMQTGAIVGIQDMGAAGLACACSEMPARAGTGMEVELSRVPQRELGMTPYEIMLSESQERMLLVAARGREAEVRRVFAKWELDAVEIGTVTDDGVLRARMRGEVVAEVPVTALADEAPIYERPTVRPDWQDALEAFDPLTLPDAAAPGRALLALMGSPTIASKEWVYRQYDQQVGINTLVLPGSDAGVLRIKGTPMAVALTTDCNARFVYLDPRRGAAMAVAEAARNLAVSGARPLGLTDCLNFGSPERPEILWQFKEAVAGIAEACRALEIPVVGGNVSFYNETLGQAILPTPVIGMAGLIEDAECRCTQWFKEPGDRVALLGPDAVSLGGSEYLWTLHRTLAGRLAPLDLDLERTAQEACRAAIEAGLVRSAHDCSEGGLTVAVAEACVSGPATIGAEIGLPAAPRPDLALFGEGPSRIVVSVPADASRALEALMAEFAIPWRWIGVVGGERLDVRMGGELAVSVPVMQIAREWRNGFERHVS
ncbi:MAG: phosphoribosylformylglycinamidine synthase II [Candidatus Rokubacteria bacterium GWC2_70_24]|nr:MAG: phosphoribosylformylglycinamidine synthase II [Candidatus Rokubacteria bacterium GWA2_70_23]OGK92074.1 MAG: phosphoribosylformylglycinamidine synthase II [Candidatus Rokubacteria bacterium GWF2_70_14]OGK92911.1 MAG: phosphoribosylformylglycinamidine synthase II [Candidatus Rokubacteria bacterium GWC2_70_24]HAM58856.1 phosphoribosylformylglycinamidine synthase subunit PurL [Candidatus Rokubacteria bacterium]